MLMLKILIVPFLMITFSTGVSNAYEVEIDEKKYKEGFVRMNDLHPSIIVNLKYTHSNNILNKKADGYNSSDALLTTEAAEALAHVQEYLSTRGFALVIYDAYHPYKTYETFKEWLLEPEDQATKETYYPNITKEDLVKIGYIQNKLDHTRGSTVDVTLIPLNQKIQDPPGIKKLNYQTVGDLVYIDDGTLDMGSSYDLFDPVSCHSCNLISQNAKENRALLKEAMEKNGFIANDKVWWQYKLAREPFADSSFDFDV